MTPLDAANVPLLGTTLIEASAGTGKTYTIATLFVRLLLERQLRVSEILVVTYTRAATAELRGRIRSRLSAIIAAIDGQPAVEEAVSDLLIARASTLDMDRQRLEEALRDFDEAAIFTIHAFCQRTLTECAFESREPFELELLEGDQALLREVALDYWARIAYPAQLEVIGMLAARIDPNKLTALAAQVVRDPDTPVLPETIEGSTATVERFRAALVKASAIWKEHRATLVAELCQGRLNGNSYKPTEIRETWAPYLDVLLQHGSFGELPDWLPRLTPELLAKRTNKGKATPQHAFFHAIAELLAAASGVQTQLLALRRAFVDYARAEVTRRQAELRTQSFDGLLVKLRDALDGPSGRALSQRVVARHPAALIDEFQDTDPVQYDIFRRLFSSREATLFLIGDPKQAIYGFRGADIFAYLQAVKAADRRHTLNVNFRSDPGLLKALDVLYTRAQRPFLLDELRFTPVEARPRATDRVAPSDAALHILLRRSDRDRPIAKGDGEPEISQLVAYEIARLLQGSSSIEGKPVAPGDIAVLCRTNKQAASTQAALAALGIPTVRDGDSSVFQTVTADELSRVLGAVAEPTDSRKLGAALASAILGVSGETLHRMSSDESGLEPWLDRFALWNQTWHERGFVQMFYQLMRDANVQARLLSRRDGERRLTDLLHLCELLQRAVVEQHLGPLALLRWFAEIRSDVDARRALATESEQIRLEHDERAVMLTTVHRSKGLEYPIVFCPFAWCVVDFKRDSVRFHDRKDQDRVKLDLGSPEFEEHGQLQTQEEHAEDLRVLYVALTRAKHRCYLVWGRFNRAEISPLGHLLHQGRRLDTDEDMLAELRALCSAAQGSIAVRDLDPRKPPDWPRPVLAENTLSARTTTRMLSAGPRLSSFSRLTAGADQILSEPATDGQDNDEVEVVTEVPTTTSQPQVLLHAFPAGARAGTMIHSIYEHIDFQRKDDAELARETERWLRSYGLDVATHRDNLSAAIDLSLRTRLSAEDPALSLTAIPRSERVDELEFTLCTPDAETRLSPAALGAAFRAHGAPAQAPDYPKQLTTLRAVPGAGFLKGFIDLVFRHGERFYIVDYKSNWLGQEPTDYAQEHLLEAMHEHHYFLQYHLYTLALHRYLRVRMRDYHYARHFGGVYYLFIRGMAPEYPLGNGILFDRPALALIESLAQALGASDLSTAGATA